MYIILLRNIKEDLNKWKDLLHLLIGRLNFQKLPVLSLSLSLYIYIYTHTHTHLFIKWKVELLVAQYCPTTCNSMDCSLPDSSVCGILQAITLEWVAIPFSRGSSQPWGWTGASCSGGRFFPTWATRRALHTY